MSYNNLEERTYVLYLNSADKISGTNNNATFNVDWQEFLPTNYNEYKVLWSFQSTGGYYKDTANSAIYTNAKILADFGSRAFCYDTGKKGQCNVLGYVTRNAQSTSYNANILTASYYQFPGKTITRPSNTLLNISIINMYSGLPFVNTTATAVAQSDMTSWSMCIEFIPIASSLIEEVRF